MPLSYAFGGQMSTKFVRHILTEECNKKRHTRNESSMSFIIDTFEYRNCVTSNFALLHLKSEKFATQFFLSC